MAARQQKPRRNPDPAPHRVNQTPLQLEQAARYLALALAVARPMFPSEDADSGSGLVVVGLWGLVALLWSAAQVSRGEIRFVFRWLDVLPGALLGFVLISTFLAETKRPAINMASEWTGLVLSFFLVRQLFRDMASIRAVVIAMLSLAFALAVYGEYQAFWGFYELRNRFASDSAKVLEEAGIAPGSPQAELFKNRLNSHEPFATFALANSLAGFLIAWIPIGLAWLIQNLLQSSTQQSPPKSLPRPGPRFRSVLLGIGVAETLAILICLILTQSRTAYIGLLVQFVLLALIFGSQVVVHLRERVSRPMLWGAIAVVAVVTVGVIGYAVRLEKMDIRLLTQAARSFEFRWQYWQATGNLIRDQIWLGTGPGNFRGHYLKYKIAESSEEIIDPHNLLLEVTATSGVIAGLAMFSMLVASIFSMFRSKPIEREDETVIVDRFALVMVGLGGICLAAVLSSMSLLLYLGLALVWMFAAAVFAGLVPKPWLTPRIFGCAAVGMVVHLMGAGGIGMPGVAQSLWLMLALGLNASELDRTPRVIGGRIFSHGLMAGMAVSVIGFVVFILRPVSGAGAALEQGRQLMRSGDLAGAEAQLGCAAEIDSLWAEPWLELARIHYEHWRRGSGFAAEKYFGQAERDLVHAGRLAPSELEPDRFLASLYEARAGRDASYWLKASEAYRRCVMRYPTSASLRAKFAETLWEAGQTEPAAKETRRALELDAQTPHLDKKLDARNRELLERRLKGA